MKKVGGCSNFRSRVGFAVSGSQQRLCNGDEEDGHYDLTDGKPAS